MGLGVTLTITQTDPSQLHNLYTVKHQEDGPQILGRSLTHAIARLDALLLVLKSCKGATCIDPWSVLHPEEPIRSLRDALNKEHDLFYGAQPKVSFDWCDAGYLIEAEGPQVPLTSRYGIPWDAWV